MIIENGDSKFTEEEKRNLVVREYTSEEIFPEINGTLSGHLVTVSLFLVNMPFLFQKA